MNSSLASSKTKLMSKPEESELLKGLEHVSIESLAPFVPNAVVIYHSNKEDVLTDVSFSWGHVNDVSSRGSSTSEIVGTDFATSTFLFSAANDELLLRHNSFR